VEMLISRRVGRVEFCPDLRVRCSPRRFDTESHLRLTLVYAWYYLKNFFLIR